MTDIHTKVYYYGVQGAVKEIRRTAHPHTDLCQFPAVCAVVRGLFGLEAFRVEYEDNERDRVVLESQEEWEECLRGGPYHAAAPLRLHVTKRKAPNERKAAHPASPQRVDAMAIDQALDPQSKGKERETAPPATSPVPASAPDAAPPSASEAIVAPIIRRHVGISCNGLVPPGWLAPAFKWAPGEIRSDEVELDINLDILEACLSHHALELMGAGDNAQALQLLQDAYAVKPRKENAYNVACCLALLGRQEEALAALELALTLGYDNFAHMLADEDLTSLRDAPQFLSLTQEQQQQQSVAAVASDAVVQVAADAEAEAAPETAPEAAAPAPVPVAEPEVAAMEQPVGEPAQDAGEVIEYGSEGSMGEVVIDNTEWETIPNAAEPAGDSAAPLTKAQQESLYKLHEVGFTCDAANLRALRATHWNVREALELLLI